MIIYSSAETHPSEDEHKTRNTNKDTWTEIRIQSFLSE